MDLLTTARHDDILTITLDNLPVNAFGIDLRRSLAAALDAAEADPEIRAIILHGAGSGFSGGADITEFSKPQMDPKFPDLVERVGAFTKPIIAAIHGVALGGGCEIAIACNYRVAVPSASLGTPEIKLGLLPGGGGTQRLPRLIGVAAALDMVTKGTAIAAPKALELGLIDRLAAEGKLIEDAIAFAGEIKLIDDLPRASDRTVAPADAVIAAFRAENAKAFRNLDAPDANIACIEAATRLPFDQGIAFERAAFMELLNGSQSAAQRHIFFAQRKSSKVDDLPAGTPIRSIARVGIIGAGTMGGGIAMTFLSASLPVTIVEQQQDALDRGVATIRKSYESAVRRGRLAADRIEPLMELLTPSLELDAVAGCDLVIEAVFENIDIKKQLFARLDAIVKPGAILATNTSFLDVNAIAAATARPQDVIGLHFFSPAHIMQLLEVVRGDRTADDVLATAMAIAKKIGKIPVVARVCPGFIGNRILAPRQSEAVKLLIEGATPEQVDKVHVDFGMPMGPFQMADLAGVDIGWHRDPGRIESLSDALCSEGRWGQKARAGYYDYDESGKASASPRVAAIIEDFRRRSNLSPRSIDETEIVERTLYPMINEAALVLEEGIAQRASDIDVAWVLGYGWPIAKGGPMFWAQDHGLATIVDGLRRRRGSFGPSFRLSPLLASSAESGGKLE